MKLENNRIEWDRFLKTEKFILKILADLTATIAGVQKLEKDLFKKTSTRLIDWIDHFIVADGDEIRETLFSLAFEKTQVSVETNDDAFHIPQAIFPVILVRRGSNFAAGTPLGAALKVDSICEFLIAHKVEAKIEGSPLSPYRRASVWKDHKAEFLVVERRGHRGFVPTEMPSDYAAGYIQVFENWASRKRAPGDVSFNMDEALKLARSSVNAIGKNTSAWIAFEVEKKYWEKRNIAGRIQKKRQDDLGLGWANHDHHTFRSSREVFHVLVGILETFGFIPRERFHAGAEAGWGAQVMEQPWCNMVAFADVDLAPGEVNMDFAHEPLKPKPELGTVGLWCALHGESMLSAGLHHLAIRLSFEEAMRRLERHGIEMMSPFSYLPHLKQAFSKGERWRVSDEHLDQLVLDEVIKKSQKRRFKKSGALGSHLEINQRSEGFKGFNQKNVSKIIKRTDPRKKRQS